MAGLFVVVVGAGLWFGLSMLGNTDIQNDLVPNVSDSQLSNVNPVQSNEVNLTPQAVSPADVETTPLADEDATEKDQQKMLPATTPIPSKTRTPTPRQSETVKKTPLPKTPKDQGRKPRQDPNCIFNNSCN